VGQAVAPIDRRTSSRNKLIEGQITVMGSGVESRHAEVGYSGGMAPKGALDWNEMAAKPEPPASGSSAPPALHSDLRLEQERPTG